MPDEITNQDEATTQQDEGSPALKEALKKERQLRASHERRVKELERAFEGVDVDEYNRLKSAQSDDVKREELHRNQVQKKDAEIAVWKDRYVTLQKQIAIDEAFLRAEGIATDGEFGSLSIIRGLVAPMLKVEVGDDGRPSVAVIDARGIPELDSKGNSLTIDGLMAHLASKDSLRAFFRSSAKPGFSAQGGRSSPGRGTSVDAIKNDASLSPLAKMRKARQLGL